MQFELVDKMNPKSAEREKVNVGQAACLDQLGDLYPQGLIDALQENVKRRKWSQKTPHFSPPSTPGSLLLISPPEAKSKYIKQQDSPHLWSVKSTENGLKGGPVPPMIRLILSNQ